jgi:hypothetical protein
MKKNAFGLLCGLILSSTSAFAGFNPVQLAVVKLEFKDGTSGYYVTDTRYQAGKTTTVPGEILVGQKKTKTQKAIVEWAMVYEGEKTSTIELDLTKPTQKIEIKDRDISVISDVAQPNKIAVLAPFGKKCSETKNFEQINFSQIKTIEFYFQLTPAIKKISTEQFSFRNHYNTCEGSKLTMGVNPYWSFCGEGGSADWVYDIKPIQTKQPGLKFLHAKGGMCGETIAFEPSTDWAKARNAGMILCFGKNGFEEDEIMSIDNKTHPEDFADLPKDLFIMDDSDRQPLKKLYVELWKNVPDALMPEKKMRPLIEKETANEDSGRPISESWTSQKQDLLEKIHVACNFESHMPDAKSP